jgi:hypothetical protein
MNFLEIADKIYAGKMTLHDLTWLSPFQYCLLAEIGECRAKGRSYEKAMIMFVMSDESVQNLGPAK